MNIDRKQLEKMGAATSRSTFRHVKTGGLYKIVRIATLESNLETMVVYESLSDGKTWVRPYVEFMDGRFKTERFEF